MNKGWFKYGNFDTRDYPNLLIEVLPNRNIAEKDDEFLSVPGNSFVGSYICGGTKSTTQIYNIALVGDSGTFGDLATFIHKKLVNEPINSILEDSYFVFPDWTIVGRSGWMGNFFDCLYDRRAYCIASYIKAVDISNLYGEVARVQVEFQVAQKVVSMKTYFYKSSTTASRYSYIDFIDEIKRVARIYGGNKDLIRNGALADIDMKYWGDARLYMKTTVFKKVVRIVLKGQYYNKNSVNKGSPLSVEIPVQDVKIGDTYYVDLFSGIFSKDGVTYGTLNAATSGAAGIPFTMAELTNRRRPNVTENDGDSMYGGRIELSSNTNVEVEYRKYVY